MKAEYFLLIFAGISALADFIAILTWMGVTSPKEALEAQPSQQALKRSRLRRAAIGLFVLTMVLVGYGFYRIHLLEQNVAQTWLYSARNDLQEIRNRNFANEEIELDGKHLHDCVLENSTLIYRGTKPYIIEHNQVVGTLRIKVTYGPQFYGLGLAYTFKDVCNELHPNTCSFEGIMADGTPAPHF